MTLREEHKEVDMTGQAEGQPVEGAVTLSDLAAEMDTTDAELEVEDGEQVEGEEGEDEAPDDEGSDDEASDDEDESEEEPTFTIKVNGKDVTLTKSEMVEMAQKGTDYSQKTMQVAEERKAAEAERTKAAEYRQQQEQAANEAAERLQALANYLQDQLGDPPSIELLHTQGSDVYLAHKEQYEHRRAKLQQAFQAQQNAQQDAQLKRQARIAEQAAETERALRDTLPGWNDEMLNSLAGYGRDHGLTPEAVGDAFVSKGLWEVLHKAKAYDAIQAQKAQLKPKAQLPKVQKPSAANHPSRAQARRAEAEKKYAANPHSLDALSALMIE